MVTTSSHIFFALRCPGPLLSSVEHLQTETYSFIPLGPDKAKFYRHTKTNFELILISVNLFDVKNDDSIIEDIH